MAATATIPANTLPFRTFSWPTPSLSAPLLLLPVGFPCEKPVAVAPDESVEEDPEPELPEDEPWLSIWAGLPPLIPGIVSAVEEADDPEAVPDAAPASISNPVPRKEASTVAFLPSTTVSLVPA